MATVSENYLAVLKAQYDYDPQPDADDEIGIKEGQLLYLLERTDEEWWKVKVKMESQDEDGPSGLVPAAYVEPAEHTSVVKALYDYDAAQPGELSIKEDEILHVYGQEEDWLLVHSQKKDGKAGFVPATYVEETTEESSSTSASTTAPSFDLSSIVIPESPPKPEYVDPQERVNQTKAKAEAGSVETWAVSELDKKGKKKKGTLGIGAGAMFFASESDKTPVQKWQTSDIKFVNIEKSKHVHIEVGGPNAATLHFHAGSKDVADAISAKLENSRPAALERPASPVERPRSSAKSVHFDNSEPEIIPPREDVGSPEPEEQQDDDDSEKAVVLYDFTADGDDEMTVHEGETLIVLERDTDEWWKCKNQHGAEGVVPANYLELVGGGATARTDEYDATAHLKAREEEERAEQERREREDAEAKEKARKAEAEQRAKAAAAAAEADQRRRQQERQKQREKEERERAAAEEAAQKKAVQKVAEKKANGSSSSGRSSSDKRGPPPQDKTRTWHDRTGQFRVEAAFLGFTNGKLRLHKINGVIIEVPSEKMSAEDMRYVEKLMAKEKAAAESSRRTSDDEPLEIRRRSLQPQPRTQAPSKKGPTIDWFEFFLSAGCDVDDCTRYASSFERDKIDEALLPDITESTMRSLGLREGDIIRVKKAIDQRQTSKGPSTSDTVKQEQIRRDEELAKQLQAEENNGGPRGQAPNLFSGPNGALKNNVRRGRPQPSKSLPPASVDLQSIASASDQIGRSSTPLVSSPASTTATSPAPAQSPPRSSSTVAVSGFDDDAWSNRPSSTKPIAPTPPAQTAVTPAAPAAPPPPPAPPAPAPVAASATLVSPPAPPASAPPAQQAAGSKLLNTTEDDIFNQLARLSQLRTQSPAVAPRPTTTSPPVVSPPPVGFQSGMGMGASPVPIGQHLQAQQTGMLPPAQSINGPRGPYAPIPANQGLLQPLVPTTTGFNSFVPTRPTSAPVQQFQPSNASFLTTQPTGFQPSLAPQPTGFQSSLAPQPTGFQPSAPMLSQPTGFQPSGPLLAQPTGLPNTGFGGAISPFQNTGSSFNSVQTNPTGFNPGFGQFGAPSPVPPQPPSQPSVNTNPANIFAQMKSGTFAADNSSDPQSAAKYDALRTNSLPLVGQPTGWGGFQGNNFQTGYGFQR